MMPINFMAIYRNSGAQWRFKFIWKVKYCLCY